MGHLDRRNDRIVGAVEHLAGADGRTTAAAIARHLNAEHAERTGRRPIDLATWESEHGAGIAASIKAGVGRPDPIRRGPARVLIHRTASRLEYSLAPANTTN